MFKLNFICAPLYLVRNKKAVLFFSPKYFWMIYGAYASFFLHGWASMSFLYTTPFYINDFNYSNEGIYSHIYGYSGFILSLFIFLMITAVVAVNFLWKRNYWLLFLTLFHFALLTHFGGGVNYVAQMISAYGI